MLKAIVSGERRARVTEAPDPVARGDWALVRVLVAPMCTEYKAFLAGTESSWLGHEAAGEVVEASHESGLRAGDRVVAMPLAGCGRCALCLSGDYIYCEDAPDFREIHGSLEGTATYAQYLLKPSRLLCRVPDDISIERASLACCALGPSYGAFQRMRLAASDTVLITGAGPVGLGAVVNAVFRGTRAIVVEANPYRAEMAAALGAAAVLDPGEENVAQRVRGMTGGRGVDCALDCSGAPEAQRVCIDAARRRGQVAFVGECYDRRLEIAVSPDMIRKGLTLHGSWHYNLADFAGVMDVIRRSPHAESLVTHRFPMSRIQEAMELSASQQCGKVLLDPWG